MSGITLECHFQKLIFALIRPSANSAYKCHNPKQIKLLTRLLFSLSCLCSHKSEYCFQESPDSLCSSGLQEESISHLPLHCSLFATRRSVFLWKIGETGSKLLKYNDSVLTHTLLFGNAFLITSTNTMFVHKKLISFYLWKVL